MESYFASLTFFFIVLVLQLAPVALVLKPKNNELNLKLLFIFVIIICIIYKYIYCTFDRLCDLVVRVSGYRPRGPVSDSRHYQIFWEVVALERGPLSLVSKIEELLGRNSSGSGLEIREYGRGDPLRWPRDTLYPQKLTLTSRTSGGLSVGIVCLRTKATGIFFVHFTFHFYLC
jgi:hypothetical protein